MTKTFRRNFDPLIGNAVMNETTFGIVPNVGASSLAAREDHTHGTPADPVAAQKAQPSGIASLDANSKVVQEPASKAQASGIASLDAGSKVVQEPAAKAQASGIASLDANSKVVQEPASKAQASGLCPLDAGSLVPLANIPAALIGKTADFVNPSLLSAENAGSVTVAAATTVIVTLDLGNVTAGQVFMVSGAVLNALKGATGGATRIGILQSSGSATINFFNSLADLGNSTYSAASDSLVRVSVFGLMVITGSGTLVINMEGLSGGSNLIVAAGEGQITAARIK